MAAGCLPHDALRVLSLSRFIVTASCPLFCVLISASSVCLCVAFPGLAPCTCFVDAAIRCLFVQRNLRSSNQHTPVFRPIEGKQTVIGTMAHRNLRWCHYRHAFHHRRSNRNTGNTTATQTEQHPGGCLEVTKSVCVITP